MKFSYRKQIIKYSIIIVYANLHASKVVEASIATEERGAWCELICAGCRCALRIACREHNSGVIKEKMVEKTKNTLIEQTAMKKDGGGYYDEL